MTDSKYPGIMPRPLRICWLFAGLILASCASEPAKNRKQLEVKTRTPAMQPTKTYGLQDNQAFRHLLNAKSLIQSGDHQAAEKELDLVRQASLSAEQRSQYELLAAQVHLSMGDAEQALQHLKSARPTLLSPEDKKNYYQSLAFAQLLQGNVLSAVNARISLGNLLQQPAEQKSNLVAILDMLGTLPDSTLNASPAMNDELNGWMALARILKQRHQAGYDINQRIQEWRQTYPKHPANADFLQAYLQTPATTSDPGQAQTATGPHIAVLLPTSGAYAPAGKAIQAGLQAAHRLAASTQPQIPLKFYDSADEDITDLYDKAVAEGAQSVIGPLVKEQIERLGLNAGLSVPVLALNHVETINRINLYQFGLSPIDEAEALALKARKDGQQHALVLTPNTTQGQRIGNYLSAAWQRHGGRITGLKTYDPKQHDIVEVFKQLAASAPTQSQALLLSANDATARELAPQLKYQQSVDLTVYAMPTVYSGRPNPSQDAELGLFGFCDIPWIFNDFYSGPLSQSALQNSWQNLPESVTRLIALGIDAYNIQQNLQQLAVTPYDGATGRLGLNSENRITRKLVCAQFKGGMPVASGYAE